jgi:hypothetical protein
MATAAEILNHKLTAVVLTATLVGGALSYMDARHASAMDVGNLTAVLQASEIARLEYMIEEIDRRIKRIRRIPEGNRKVFEQDDLVDMEAKREYLLRELERLEER